jgi:hypothetical protein
MRVVSQGLMKSTALPLVLLLVSCASQTAVQRPSNGMSVFIGDGGKCRTDGATAAHSEALLPDGELCKTLATKIRSELGRAGFTVVEQEASPHELTLHLAASQKTVENGVGLNVQLRVEHRGDEVESLLEASPDDAGDESGGIAAVARALADDMASSPRLRHLPPGAQSLSGSAGAAAP